ncbi:MAG: MFS transporter [Alphaproteobacteria bacterium]|nr:MFS transporter [Alphaproteobacteria bacterium]QMU56966.1 MAG: MFS transporter [Boseongicola sp.]
METKELNRGAILIMALFFLQPMAIGSWLALIPYVKETIGLSKSELAIALLGAPVALLITLQFASKAVGTFGVRKLFLVAFPLQFLTSLLPITVGSMTMLFFALAAFGIAIAFMEIALNVYAGRVEKSSDRLIMNRCHGFWALGLMTGSIVATSGSQVISPLGIMAIISVASATLGVGAAFTLPKVGEAEEKRDLPRRKLSQLPSALLAIGSFMFLVTLTEGAMADWAAVYLSERLNSNLLEAGIAVTIFSGFMAAGRFSGDFLKLRFGALILARGSVSLAAVGLLFLVLPLPLAFAYIGFAFVGLGVAAGYPLGVSAVSALDDTYEAGNVAIMATCALAGFLVGPPLIGFLADAFSLRVSFAVLIPGLVLCLILAKRLRTQNPGN